MNVTWAIKFLTNKLSQLNWIATIDRPLKSTKINWFNLRDIYFFNML